MKGLGYLQKVDLIAVALGFKNQAALMSAFAKEEESLRKPRKVTEPVEFRWPEQTFTPTQSGSELNPERRTAVHQHVLATMSPEEASLFLNIVVMRIQEVAGNLEIAQEVVDIVKSALALENTHAVFRSGVRIDIFIRNLENSIRAFPQGVEVPQRVLQFAEVVRSGMTIGEEIKLVELMSQNHEPSPLNVDVVKKVVRIVNSTLRFEDETSAFQTGMTVGEIKQKIREILVDTSQAQEPPALHNGNSQVSDFKYF